MCLEFLKKLFGKKEDVKQPAQEQAAQPAETPTPEEASSQETESTPESASNEEEK